MIYKSWTTDEELELKRLYESATKEELVNKFNTDWNKIKDKAKKLGGLNRKACKVDETALIKDYESGLKLTDIWTKYNISNPTLLKILKKHNISKKNTKINDIDTKSFKNDYITLSRQELISKYNLSPPSINTLANKLKLTRPAVFLYKQPKLLKQEQEICDKYSNKNNSMRILAKEYAVTDATIHRILHKHNIPIKEGIYGATEDELRTWVEEVTGLLFPNNKTVLDGKEIDLYSDTSKIGIEYCGLLWHSEYFRKSDKNYHYDKYKLAKQQGIHLITIFEDEWLNRQKQVKGVLLSLLQKNSRRLYARKCIVKTIDKKTGDKFYDDYHIQGKASLGKYFAGLYYEDELIGVMSFGLHHRDTTKYTLDRLCFKYDVSISGGSGKLFKFLLKTSGIKELSSWSDNRWFQGNVYNKLGFIKTTDMKPDYSYVNIDTGKRHSKQSQKKSNTGCPKNITEKDWAQTNKLYRIWDCGKIKWVFNTK